MIDFFFEELDAFELNQSNVEAWLNSSINEENKVLGEVTIIFCSDDYLLEINKTHLNHDYFTDIITFDYCEDNVVSGDLFISVDRVKDNAVTNKVVWQNELNRVMIHGVLHLCGYKDKTEKEVSLMREKENYYLKLI